MKNAKGYNVPDGVAADLVVLTKKEDGYYMVLIERGKEPFGYAVPGGHLDEGETLKQCAFREFEEECSVKLPIEEGKLLNEYSIPGMEPRGWYVTVAYLVVVSPDELTDLKAKDDAKNVVLCKLNDVADGKYKIAFMHHKEIVKDIVKFLGKDA